MKKLSISCLIACVLVFLTGTAFAISLKLDFYGGDTTYTKGTFENPQEINLSKTQTVLVDVWIVDWPLTANLVVIQWYFRWHTPSLEVQSFACNNLKSSGGQWEQCVFHITGNGEIYVNQIDWDLFRGIPGPNIQLATFTLKCTNAPSDDWIMAQKEYISDVDGGDDYDVSDANGTIHQTVTCTYSISPTSQSFNSSGGTGSVSVTTQSECSWTATSNASWITITSGSSGIGSGTVDYSVSANITTSQRTGTMTIAGQQFTVTEQGFTCTYSISPTSQSFNSSGGTGNVSVTTQNGCAWTAVSNASWIAITSGSSGTGNGTVSYSVSVNTSTSQRTGTMTIAEQTFTVTQEGICTYTISPSNQSFESPGGTGSISVTTQSGCAWTATSNDSWITITSGSSGTGNGTVYYSVSANTGTSSRTGTMTIAGKTFPVTQGGQECSGPTITVGTVSACNAETQVEVPVTISDTAERPDCSFSISFDKTELQYTGKISGDMNATVLTASTAEINAAGNIQAIIQFEEGGATSGTICKFKFSLLTTIPEGDQTNLDIGALLPQGIYCGKSGAVTCGGEVTWDDIIETYNDYVNGTVTWDEVIAAYQAYANQ